MTHTHLTDPDCPQSVRDQINGGVTQEARAIAAAGWPKGGAMQRLMLSGRFDHHGEVQAAQRALTTAQAEREQLEARVQELEAALVPFSQEANDWDPEVNGGMVFGDEEDVGSEHRLKVKHLRKARTAVLGYDPARAALQEQRP